MFPYFDDLGLTPDRRKVDERTSDVSPSQESWTKYCFVHTGLRQNVSCILVKQA